MIELITFIKCIIDKAIDNYRTVFDFDICIMFDIDFKYSN